MFVVIMTSWLTLTFYTSVLISSLTIPLINPPFKDIAGLLEVKSYDMGLQKGNSEVERFRTSKDPIIEQVWSKIVMRNPNNLVQTAEEGIRKVLEEKFAFFVESGYYFYHNKNNCSLIPVGGTVFRYGAGIAVQKGSPLRLILNYHILRQEVTGVSDRIKRKYKPPRGYCKAPSTESLGMQPLAIAFVILLAGLVMSLMTLNGEIFCLHRIASADRHSRKVKGFFLNKDPAGDMTVTYPMKRTPEDWVQEKFS
ncbi:glutamate receptor ionotropic, kainate 2-like [Palaemon carinicauda]|uniref:glutamate receptor ionotropic, kainate 2-like n=1 Tax=Palaemon carinicauda TaxID=392227 RepID=UPI0035B66555